jgi:hypothetical protein
VARVRAGRVFQHPVGSLLTILGDTFLSTMSRKKVTPKKRGRPATGKDPVRTFRLSDEKVAEVEAWAARQPDKPSRSKALRRLIDIGLNAPARGGRKRAK